MADKTPPLAYLPEVSPEATEANRAYQEALQRLTASIDQRKNRFMDPRFAAAAKAFLTPTKTGSGFEALGNVVGAVGEAQEGLLREEQDIAKLQADVAAQRLGLERQRQLYNLYAGDDEGAGSGPGMLPSGGAPIGGVLPGGGIQIAPPMQMMSRSRFMAGKAIQGVDPATAEKDWADYQSKFRDVKEAGEFRAGAFYPTPSAKNVSVRIFGPGQGKVYDNIPETLAIRLNVLDPSDPEYIRLANLVLTGETGVSPTPAPQRIESVPSGELPETAGQPPLRGRIESAEDKERRKAEEQVQRDISKAREEATAKEVGQSEGVRRNAIFDGAASAEDSERQATMLKQFAEDPSASKMFGLLSKPGVWPAIGRLIETGVGANQFRIGIPELQTALTTAGLNEREIAQYQTALQAMVNFQLRMSQYVKGAVSNYEQGLFQRASINQNDRPETIRMKANLAILLADFARRKAELFEDANVSTTKFIRSPQYQRLLRDTDDKMEAITRGKGVRRREKSQTQGGNTADRLRDELGG